jgi:glycosyltransferase involved in cell wall biosynthesis
MRVLYLHPRSWSGEHAMLKELRRLGDDVCALEEKRGLAARRWLVSDHFLDSADGIATCWYDPGRGWEKLATWPLDRIFKRGFEGRNLVHRMWMIRKAVKHFAPDVVVCSDGFTFAVPAAFLKRLGLLHVPLVVGYIGGDILDCPHADYGRPREGLTGRLLRSSFGFIDLFRPVSPMLKDILVGDGVSEDRIAVCPSHLVAPAVTLEDVRANRVAIGRKIRTHRGIAEDAPLVVTLSANGKGKGLHILAAAWPAVLRMFPDARWLLCGPESPWLAGRVRPMLASQGVAHTVVATGSLSGNEVFEHLAAADLHVNPTLCEGLNMATVEAAAVGTPTIGTDGAGIAAWMERFDAGPVVRAGEEGPLAAAIIRAFQQPSRLADWSRASSRMSEEFSLERIAASLRALMRTAALQGMKA